MNTAIINIKTTPETKKEAQKVADELGLSLSTLINALLKQVVRTQSITLSTTNEEPTEFLLNALKESAADKKAGRVSPSFNNADDAINWLDNPHRTYEG
jgi:addiction module RelB/DinJ family antitoxin